MRSYDEIKKKLEQVQIELKRLNDMYDNDEITYEGFRKSHKTLCTMELQLKWVLGEVIW